MGALPDGTHLKVGTRLGKKERAAVAQQRARQKVLATIKADIDDKANSFEKPSMVVHLLRRVGHFAKPVRLEIFKRRRAKEIENALKGSPGQGLLPHFLIIGAPKCGTSWLRGVLAQHPQVAMVTEEIEYFSSYLDRPLNWYTAHFAPERLMQGEKAHTAPIVIGEKSASYCVMGADRIRLAHRLLPEARLVLMIRDPVSRHWAHAKQYFSKIHRGRLHISKISRKELFAFFLRIQRFSEFSSMLANWTDVYPADRLLVVFQEEAFDYPQRILDRVLQHVGATNAYDPGCLRLLTKRKNVGPSIPMPEDVRLFLEDLLGPERERLRTMLACAKTADPADVPQRVTGADLVVN